MSKAPPLRLGINVDHVATLRNARGGARPDPVRLALAAIAAGADGITAHLREDRRHIRDEDMARLKAEISKPLNFEMAATDGHAADFARHQAARASAWCPSGARNSPPRAASTWSASTMRWRRSSRGSAIAGIRVSLFIAADPRQIEMAVEAEVRR